MVRIALTIGFIILIALIAALFVDFTKAKTIALKGDESCLSRAKLESYNLDKKNLLILNTNKLSKNLKTDFSCIDQVEIIKDLPDSLIINFSANPDLVKIEGTNLIIQKDGKTKEKVNEVNLPTIFLPSQSSYQKEQTVQDPIILAALEIVQFLTKSDFTLQNIRFTEGNDIAIYDTKGTVALFSSTKEASSQVDSLQSILSKAKINELKIAKIDLRFDKPVIVNK